MLTRLGCGLPQGNCSYLNRGTRNGWTLIGRPIGVTEDHRYVIEGKIELLGRDLSECRTNTRAKIDMGIKDRYLSISGDGQKRVDLIIGDAPGTKWHPVGPCLKRAG